MKEVLIVRPDWGDIACRWGAEWLKRKSLNYFQSEGWKVIDLYANNANRINILAQLNNVSYASLLGHGNETTYTANRTEKVLWVDDDETLRICRSGSSLGLNFLSCLVGDKLAPWMVENGIRAIMAFTQEFVFGIDYNNFPNSIAEPFFDAYASADYYIAKGLSFKEAHDYRLATWRKYIQQAEPEIRRYLIHDYNCDELFGDGNFKPIEVEGWRELIFEGEVTVKGWFIPKKYNFSGTVKVKEG